MQLEDKADQRQKKRRENAERKRYNFVIDAADGLQVASKVRSGQLCWYCRTLFRAVGMSMFTD
jgi:hypothetical protein